MRRKVLYAGIAAALLLNVIVFVHSRVSKPKGYLIRAASDACSCYSERPTRVVHLHITLDGSLSINTEPTDRRHIANQLYDIYSARAERVLYLSSDPGVPYQDVTEVIDLIRNVGARRSVPLPTALKNADSERLDIEVRFVTDRAADVKCGNGCFNWAKQPPIEPLVQVQNAEDEMCRDDTLSPTEWFNVPSARFSASAIQLNGRPASEQEFAIWADDYYRTKAERALWVQISPDGKPNAERVLMPIVRSYPDIQLRQVKFGFACPKLKRRE